MSVYKKLNNARILLQNSNIKKSGFNKFSNYQYFELGDFLPTINNIFNEIGLCGVISFGVDIATLTITDIDDMSQVIINSPMSSAALKGCHDVQNLGAVQTYLRRYLWVTALEIVEHDAIEPVTGKKEEGKKQSITNERLQSAIEKIKEGSYTLDKLQDTFALTNEQKSLLAKLLGDK